MVPLAAWVQETWQMIDLCECFSARVHPYHTRTRKTGGYLKDAGSRCQTVYILNIEGMLKDHLKRKHPSSQDICFTVF